MGKSWYFPRPVLRIICLRVNPDPLLSLSSWQIAKDSQAIGWSRGRMMVETSKMLFVVLLTNYSLSGLMFLGVEAADMAGWNGTLISK